MKRLRIPSVEEGQKGLEACADGEGTMTEHHCRSYEKENYHATMMHCLHKASHTNLPFLATFFFATNNDSSSARRNCFTSAFQSLEPVSRRLKASPVRCQRSIPMSAPSTLLALTSMQHAVHSRRSLHCGAFGSASFNFYHGRTTTLLRKDEDDHVWAQDTGNENKNYDNRQRRKQKRQWNDSMNSSNNVVATILEFSIGLLFQPVYFPFSISFSGSVRRRRSKTVPLVYPLSILFAAAVVPPITWGLLLVSFSAYLALGMLFMEEYNDLGRAVFENVNERRCSDPYEELKEEEDFDKDDENDENKGVVPFAALTGAFVSAALLSPQGLISGKVSFFPSPVALCALGLGGIAIIMGIRGTEEEEQRWEEERKRGRMERVERRRMDRWDKELEGRDRKEEKED